MDSIDIDKDESHFQKLILLCIQSFSFMVYTVSLIYVLVKVKKHIMTRFALMLALFALVFSVRLTVDIFRVVKDPPNS